MESQATSPYLVVQHLVYLTVALSTTVWVGRTLYKNGAAFLAETFLGKELLADSVNRLLLVGFYLINCGWVVRTLKDRAEPWTAAQVIENVAMSYGSVLLILGVMHFANLYVLTRMRRRAIAERGAAPIAPEQYFRPSAA
jgi:uncharacterized membrane protein (DUF485 family)